MNYYINIKLHPDEEVPIYFIRNKIYTKFHKALFILKSTNIGLSFPNCKEKTKADNAKLGDVIRIHGNEARLTELQASNWLGGLSGYCDLSAIQVIPDNSKHRNISRKQANMTQAKLRRLIKRGSINSEEAKQYKAKMFSQSLDNPYFELDSTSNGNKHRRYIAFGALTDEAVTGEFDCFGLSKTATVPWF